MLKRNSIFAGVHVLAVTGALFLTYRILSAGAGLAALGAWSLASAFSSFLSVADLGVTDAMVREVPRRRRANDLAGVSRIVAGSTALAALSISLLAFAALPVIRLGTERILGHVDPAYVLGAILVAILNVVSAGFLGTLEGLERYGVRLSCAVVSSLALLCAAAVWIPMYAANALPAVFLAQAVSLAVSSAISVGLCLRTTGRLALPRAQEMLALIRFGMPLRLVGLLGMAFEPLTRVLLASFGNASTVGIYEIAARMVGQVRNVVVGATQAVLPRMVMTQGTQADDERSTLAGVQRIVRPTAQAVFSAVVLVLPAASFLLLGRIEPTFVAFGALLSAGWYVNVLSTPAYFANIADARLAGNVASHAVLAALNLLLGPAFGAWLGAVGVVAGVAIALAAASVVTILSQQRWRAVSWRSLAPRADLALGAAATALPAVAIAVANPTARAVALVWGAAAAGFVGYAAHSLRRVLKGDVA